MNKSMRYGLMVMILCSCMHGLFADYGRSPLIEFIIEQEAEIAKLRQEVQDLIVKKEFVRLQQRSVDLEQCIEMTLHDIEMMSDTGALFNVVDDFGKTALSYCQSEEIYLKLRHCGMEFQYDAWLYIYRSEIMKVSFGVAVVAGLLFAAYQ